MHPVITQDAIPTDGWRAGGGLFEFPCKTGSEEKVKSFWRFMQRLALRNSPAMATFIISLIPSLLPFLPQIGFVSRSNQPAERLAMRTMNAGPVFLTYLVMPRPTQSRW